MIKKLREENGMTQAELATHLGITQSAVAQWEMGITKPAIDKLLKIAEYLGCTIEELLKQRLDET